MAQQQADALALLAEAALHSGIDPGTSGERYQVVVHVDAAVLANADQPGQSCTRMASVSSASRKARCCSITLPVWELPHVPQAPAVPADPIRDVQKENAANGLQIDPTTLKPAVERREVRPRLGDRRASPTGEP